MLTKDDDIVACKDIDCSWSEVPHWHEGADVYPLPTDAPEWTLHLLSGSDMEVHESC